MPKKERVQRTTLHSGYIGDLDYIFFHLLLVCRAAGRWRSRGWTASLILPLKKRAYKCIKKECPSGSRCTVKWWSACAIPRPWHAFVAGRSTRRSQKLFPGQGFLLVNFFHQFLSWLRHFFSKILLFTTYSDLFRRMGNEANKTDSIYLIVRVRCLERRRGTLSECIGLALHTHTHTLW